MAALTWRNVDAPDYRASMQGLNNAASAFNDSMGAIDGALTRFDNKKTSRVNDAFAAKLATFNNPDDLNAALAEDATLGMGSRVSSDNLHRGRASVSQLLGEVTSRENLEHTRDERTRVAEHRQLRENAREGMAELAAARDSGDPARIAAATEKWKHVQQGLPFEDMIASFGQLSGIESNRMGIMNTRQSYDQSGTRFGWESTDRRVEQEADALAYSGQHLDKDSFLRSLEGVDPQVRAAAMRKAGISMFPDLDAGSGGIGGISGLGGGAGGANPVTIMNYEARASGFDAVPDTVKTLGQASDFALQVNAANKKRTGENGSSAMGLYQIVGSTMRGYAEKMYGSGWRNKEFTPQVQDEIAAEIFKDNRGSAAALKKQWVSLSLAEAEQVRNMPWERARDIISKKESGGVASQILSGLIDQQDLQARNINTVAAHLEANAGNRLPGLFMQAAGSEESPREVAARMAKADPSLDANWLEGRIKSLMGEVRGMGNTRRNVNAAIVGEAIGQTISAQSSEEGWYNPKRWLPDSWRGNTVGTDTVYDHQGALASLGQYASGKMDKILEGNLQREQGVQLESQATAALTQAQQRLQRKLDVARQRGIRLKPEDVQQEQQDIATAQALVGAGQAVRNQPGHQLPGGSPAPTPTRAQAPTPTATPRQPAQPTRAANPVAQLNDTQLNAGIARNTQRINALLSQFSSPEERRTNMAEANRLQRHQALLREEVSKRNRAKSNRGSSNAASAIGDAASRVQANARATQDANKVAARRRELRRLLAGERSAARRADLQRQIDSLAG